MICIEHDPSHLDATAQSFRVMLVDDHILLRHGLESLINAESDLQVVAQASSAEEAIEKLSEVADIDVILLDIHLKDSVDLDVVHRIASARPDIRILIVSMHNEKLYAERALRAGALGYVMKHERSDTLLAAIRTVASREIHLSQAMAAYMLKQGIRSDKKGAIESLTKMEIEILRLISAGFSSNEIAVMKVRSVKTIEAHRANIRAKLALKDGADLIRFATRHFPSLDW